MSGKIEISELRRLVATAQGLTARPEWSVVDSVEQAGFVRTLGGVDVYLALRARVPSMTRADLDGAVAAGELAVIPAVRGCIYLVPRREVPWALRLAVLLSGKRAAREQEKAGIRSGEIAELGATVVNILAEKGPLTVNALRRALPEGAVRSLGEAGKKVGISSTLPPTLRRLEFAGAIARQLEGGRLDTERYLWHTPERSPFDGIDLPEEVGELHAHFAELYFRAAGVGAPDIFAAWAGIGKRDARAAAAALALTELEVAGVDGPRYRLQPAAGMSSDTSTGGVAFLPFHDNLVHLQGGPAVLVDPEHRNTPVPMWGRGKAATLGDVRHMSFRSIVIDGRLVGFWEYDPDAAVVVTGCFARLGTADREAVATEATALAGFIRDELGHGKSFSLDTDEALRKRVGQIRNLA